MGERERITKELTAYSFLFGGYCSTKDALCATFWERMVVSLGYWDKQGRSPRPMAFPLGLK